MNNRPIRQREDSDDIDISEQITKILRTDITYNIYDYMLPFDKIMYDWIITVCASIEKYLKEAMTHIFSYNKYAYTPKLVIFGSYIRNLLMRSFGHHIEFKNVNIWIFLIDKENKAEIKSCDGEAMIPTRIWCEIMEYTFKKMANSGYDIPTFECNQSKLDKYHNYNITINGFKFNFCIKRNFNEVFNKLSDFTINTLFTYTNGLLHAKNNCNVKNVLNDIKMKRLIPLWKPYYTDESFKHSLYKCYFENKDDLHKHFDYRTQKMISYGYSPNFHL
jgi:hypothetical protein